VITITIYKNRDNTVDLEMRADGRFVNISGTTKMVLTIGDTVIDSSRYASAFDWSTNGSAGQLILDLGRLNPILAMRNATYLATLDFYDAQYTNGIRWGNGLQAKISE
jgi:hypothetical protein